MERGLVCWWCVHDLPQHPCLHLPIKYDPLRKKYTTIGNFCSWECAKAYALDWNIAKSAEIQSFLALMRLQTYKTYLPLFAAPKRTALKIFGGTMSIEEFRGCFGKTPPVVEFPNEIQLHQKVGYVTATPVPDQNSKSKLKAIEEASTVAEPLKLKRSQPLARSKSKLESALGITRKTT